MGKRWLSNGAGGLTAIGVLLLAVYTGGLIHRVVFSDSALREFDRARRLAKLGDAHVILVEQVAQQVAQHVVLEADEKVDFSSWAKNRVLRYRESLLKMKGPPLAVLRFRKMDLRVPVFEGTDDLTLNRGAGWIENTARPGEAGNIGIAGHRDGFFSGLKDVAKGDAIELATVVRTVTYIVDEIEIVDPSDVGVLRPRAAPSVTLVTCYPFYFVGRAPRRFIVHAALSD